MSCRALVPVLGVGQAPRAGGEGAKHLQKPSGRPRRSSQLLDALEECFFGGSLQPGCFPFLFSASLCTWGTRSVRDVAGFLGFEAGDVPASCLHPSASLFALPSAYVWLYVIAVGFYWWVSR